MKYENIPQKLKDTELFCLWRYEGKDKVPYQPNGRKASVSNPSTFYDFDTIIDALTDEYDGIGILLRKCTAEDLDDCIKGGVISPFAREIIDRMDTYTEISPSGTGIRIVAYAPKLKYDKKKYYVNNRKIHMEIYVAGETDKFVTITGNVIRDADIEDRSEEIQSILDDYMLRPPVSQGTAADAPGSFLSDESVIGKALDSRQADKFEALWKGKWQGRYDSQSEADLALCEILAFWCGGDKEQIDRLFRESELNRPKWDERRGAMTYGEMTVSKAVSLCRKFYSPVMISSPEEDFNDILPQLKKLDPVNNPRYQHGDIGCGRLFADIFKGNARYVPERKMYYIYDGIRWIPDIGNLKAMELCKDLADTLLLLVKDIGNESKRSFFLDNIKKWYSRRSREIYLKEAQSVYPISASEFDKDKLLLNCLNGTYDLSSGKFREHDPKDLITRLAPTIYDPEAFSERFIRFIEEIMCEDRELERFLQKALGYGISGETFLECLIILYGMTTRNGKGTLAESVKGTLGTYAAAARPETIAQKNTVNSQSPSEDLARLAGIRFVNVSEPRQCLLMNAALVKNMTGNDTLNVRFLHENSFEYRPQFKLYINTNYLPAVTDMTLFTSGRVIVITFDRHFEEWEQDKTLKEDFSKPEVRSAILNWLIEGYHMVKSEDLNIPQKVLEVTEAYQRDSDKIRQFADACLIEDGSKDVRTSEVYAVYRIWCSNNGYYPENRKNFNQSLRTIGVVTRKRPLEGGEKTTVLIGYALLTDSEFL